MLTRYLAVWLLVLTGLAGLAPVAAAQPAQEAAAVSGPTAYPSEASQWPGKGVVRVFGWMVDNRREFWRQREHERGRVVFAGDSLVAGWRTLKQDFPSVPVANRGIGGDVSRGLLFRFQEDVLDLQPTAVVIQIGTNDLSAQQAPADTVSNLVAMIEMARRHDRGLPIVVCTVPPRAHPQAPIDPAKWRELNAGIRALADRQAGVSVVELAEPLSAPDGSIDPRYFATDRLHLSAQGYERWKSALQPALAPLRTSRR